MTEHIELEHGSGNVFQDFSFENADVEQAKAILAARIISILDEKNLSVRAAQTVSGMQAADFSRIRNVKLDRFTIDRLVGVINKLDTDLEVQLRFSPRLAL